MNDTKNLQIDTKNTVCYTDCTSDETSDMHLDNGIQQTDKCVLTTSLSKTTRTNVCDEYIDVMLPTMEEQSSSLNGGSMDYLVSHEGKFVSVFGEKASEDDIRQYAAKGYKIAYFLRGTMSVVDVIRGIVLDRCVQR